MEHQNKSKFVNCWVVWYILDVAVNVQKRGESIKAWAFKASELDFSLEVCIGFKLGRGSKRNHMNKDERQHRSGTGKEGVIMRMISKEQITRVGTTWIQVTCKKKKKKAEERCKKWYHSLG